MRTLLKNGTVVNVFTGEIEKAQVLLENERIIGVGDYCSQDADAEEDLTGTYICPGFIDGHIHIESSMLLQWNLRRRPFLTGRRRSWQILMKLQMYAAPKAFSLCWRPVKACR